MWTLKALKRFSGVSWVRWMSRGALALSDPPLFGTLVGAPLTAVQVDSSSPVQDIFIFHLCSVLPPSLHASIHPSSLSTNDATKSQSQFRDHISTMKIIKKIEKSITKQMLCVFFKHNICFIQKLKQTVNFSIILLLSPSVCLSAWPQHEKGRWKTWFHKAIIYLTFHLHTPSQRSGQVVLVRVERGSSGLAPWHSRTIVPHRLGG